MREEKIIVHGNPTKENWIEKTISKSFCNSGLCAKSDCHTKCHDCGQFLKKHLWVPKDHRWKKHALCLDCLSNYDDPNEF